MLGRLNSAAVAPDVLPPNVDVCMIVEGCYPYVAGGVSTWLDWLIRTQPQLSFGVLAIISGPEPRLPRYKRPENLTLFREINLNDARVLSRRTTVKKQPAAYLGALFAEIGAKLLSGGKDEFARLLEAIHISGKPLSLETLMNSALAWEAVQRMYRQLAPHSSFLQFFWAWRALFGGLFRVATCPLPRAGVYHAVSTGYAGLLAARGAIETGTPAIITEHGIYTNERRIDILLADWINDTVEKGVSLDDLRLDVRDIWVKAFEAYARCAYESAALITTLYHENQILQRLCGADDSKLRIIANGIDVSTFEGIGRASPSQRPTVALISRVVPIKDVKTFIRAVGILRQEIPEVEGLILGPTDEDSGYFEECKRLVWDLGLTASVTFTGGVRVTDYFSRIHVVALTSLSEAQPLVVLEAGAAGIPCVTTNVGCCRELLEGHSEESPPLGRGGFITDAVSPEQSAASIGRLLKNAEERRIFGSALKARVERYYTSARSSERYALLYEEAFAMSASTSTSEKAA